MKYQTVCWTMNWIYYRILQFYSACSTADEDDSYTSTGAVVLVQIEWDDRRPIAWYAIYEGQNCELQIGK